MGSQTTTTKETIQGAGTQEQQLMGLLQRLATKSAGQMGDLSGLAGGQIQGPSAADYELVQGIMDRTGGMAQRDMERNARQLTATLGENLTARGVKGSSAELLGNLLNGQELQGRLADIMAQAQNQGAGMLAELPFQRANTQLSANQLLFNMLTGAANPVLQNSLTARMANRTTTQKTPMNPMQIAGMAASLAGAIPTGGMSLAAMPGLAAGGGAGGSTFNSAMADFGHLPLR